MKCGPTIGHLEFDTVGILNHEAGTVEMWVCPLDWYSDDGKFHVFFEVRGRGALYLYKYWTSTNLLMLTCPEVVGPYFSSQIPTDFKPAEWHHIAGTWSAKGVMAYLDGKPVSGKPAEGELPIELGTTMQIGDRPWQFERSTASLVDEVHIYDRALTPAHIAAHYAGDFDFIVPLSAENSSLEVHIDPETATADVFVDSGGADIADARLQAIIAIVAENEPLPDDTPAVPFANGRASGTLSLPIQEPGNWQMAAWILKDGNRMFELRRTLIIPDTSWLGNRLGLDDRVLPPWTPMQMQGTTILCWGRRYDFDSTFLPTQVNSNSADLLVRPVSLRLISSEGFFDLADQQIAVVSSSPTRCELRGTATAQMVQTNVCFTSRISVEYDGLMLIELSCDSPAELSIEGLSLEMALPAKRAMYQHRYVPSWVPTSGFVPAGEGTVDKTSFIPYVWLGDNDRGLFWFCESDEMWPNRAAENCIEIVRYGHEIRLCLNLLAVGQTLPVGWKLTFGLQATPVKPIPRNWRKWRFSPGREANVQIVWPLAGHEDSLSDFGYPRAANPEIFLDHINGLHGQGLKALPYLCLTWITDSTPE